MYNMYAVFHVILCIASAGIEACGRLKGAWSLKWRGLVSSSWAHTQHVHLELLIFDDTLLKELLSRVEVLVVTNGSEVT
jgi:hypothetical protein